MTSTLKPLPPAPRRRSLLGIEPTLSMLPRDMPDMPPTVAQANENAWKLRDRQDEAQERLRVAQAELDAAPSPDSHG